MIFKKILDIKYRIEKYRKELLNISKEKPLSDPDVLVMTRKIDEEIITMQKLINNMH
ncbi:hypothetical protein COJ96_23830 [Bacillus sp. AFS073361]|uniref:Spo0E family sporulation regulatory protein-aspartic acid phosphatase n=1 Tax=Bacillaceae TaxID=186817 RepID=UPI000BF659FA|nr:Spo0E family sporulation regulatory protein-aspartic acid phosphatase [Bacillus sp. AFS073361]PFP23609.1 hypothetical protein COJ96_23830 [Bacillus sp. AFS073361]